MKGESYVKLIDTIEYEIEVTELRILFWQKKIAQAKNGKDGMMQELGRQQAQSVIQKEWLEYVKGRRSVENSGVEVIKTKKTK